MQVYNKPISFTNYKPKEGKFMKINQLLFLVGCVLLTGCSSVETSKTADAITPTQYIITINTPTASAEITKSVTPTSEPTKEIVPTKTPLPTASPTPSLTPTPAPEPGASKTYRFNLEWEFAGFSKINTGSSTLYRTTSASPKNKTICVNAGHGTEGGTNFSVQCHPDGSPKIVSGSTSAGQTTATAIAYGTIMKNGISEAQATKNLALVLKDVLLDNGYDVLMIRESDNVQLDNIARTVMANNLADCHIAIHYDSTDYDKGAFYMSVPDVASYKDMYPVNYTWQENNRLGESIMSGFRANNIKIFSSGSMEMDLVQMSYSSIPNIDLEIGDIASDCSESALNKIAQGILDGLNRFYQ